MIPALRRALAGVAVCLGPSARAQEALPPAGAPPAAAVVLVRAGRVFDSEHGTFLPARDLVIRGERIDAVGERLAVPPGARVIDLSRYTLLPGLIDAHTHLLTLERPGAGPAEVLSAVAAEGTPLRALHGAARARTFLEAGITTVRDLGNAGRFGDVALRTAIADGSVVGPRMFVSGPGISPEGGQYAGLQPAARALAAEEYAIVHNTAEAADAVRQNAVGGADVIKVYAESTPNRGVLSLDELRAVVEAARRHGLRVAAHATSDAAVWRAAQAGVASIEHAYDVSDSTLALMRRNGVALVPTDTDSLLIVRITSQPDYVGPRPGPADITRYLAPSRDRLRRALRAGVSVVAGSDMYLDLRGPQGAAAKRVLFAYAAAGMPNVQVLQAATVNAARLLGRERELGVVRAGALADLVAVEGDPGTDLGALEHVRFVMQRGAVVTGPPTP